MFMSFICRINARTDLYRQEIKAGYGVIKGWELKVRSPSYGANKELYVLITCPSIYVILKCVLRLMCHKNMCPGVNLQESVCVFMCACVCLCVYVCLGNY